MDLIVFSSFFLGGGGGGSPCPLVNWHAQIGKKGCFLFQEHVVSV